MFYDNPQTWKNANGVESGDPDQEFREDLLVYLRTIYRQMEMSRSDKPDGAAQIHMATLESRAKGGSTMAKERRIAEHFEIAH